MSALLYRQPAVGRYDSLQTLLAERVSTQQYLGLSQKVQANSTDQFFSYLGLEGTVPGHRAQYSSPAPNGEEVQRFLLERCLLRQCDMRLKIYKVQRWQDVGPLSDYELTSATVQQYTCIVHCMKAVSWIKMKLQ
jgi:hypothetical protein